MINVFSVLLSSFDFPGSCVAGSSDFLVDSSIFSTPAMHFAFKTKKFSSFDFFYLNFASFSLSASTFA